MSYRIVIYIKRKGILIFISYIIAENCAKLWSHIASLKIHRTHAHRKFQKNGFARAHRNSQLAIAHRKSCLASDDYVSHIPNSNQSKSFGQYIHEIGEFYPFSSDTAHCIVHSVYSMVIQYWNSSIKGHFTFCNNCLLNSYYHILMYFSE